MNTQVKPSKTLEAVLAGLPKRRAAEKRFRFYGLISIVIGLVFLVVLFASIISKGYSAFTYTYVGLDVAFDPAVIDPEGTKTPSALANADYDVLWKGSVAALFPDVTERLKKRSLNSLISGSAAEHLKEAVIHNPSIIGTTQRIWVPADDNVSRVSG